MGIYFLDTSAIVKRYVLEQGRAWMLNVCDPSQEHSLYISQAALVEVVAALCKKAREQNITLDDRNNFVKIFRQHCRVSYGIMLVTNDIYVSAGDLCFSHKLRAYDAIQLACALTLRDDAAKNKAPLPIFACADIDLLKAAEAEGLHIENLNLYP